MEKPRKSSPIAYPEETPPERWNPKPDSSTAARRAGNYTQQELVSRFFQPPYSDIFYFFLRSLIADKLPKEEK